MKKSLLGGKLKGIRMPKIAPKKLIAGGLFAGIFIGAYSWRLGSLTNGFTAAEALNASQSMSLSGLWNNPIDMPHNLLAYLFSFISSDLMAMRLASSCFALLAILLFYALVKRWHGQLPALLATLLFGLSAVMLHSGRAGVSFIVSASVVLAMLVFAHQIHSASGLKLNGFRLLLLSIAGVACLYTPGMIWILLLAVIFNSSFVVSLLKRFTLRAKLLVSFGFLVAIAPLVWHIVQQPLDGTLAVIGMQQHPETIIEGLKLLAQLPLFIGFGGFENAALWLGDAPLFDVFVLVMSMLGLYYYLVRGRKSSSLQESARPQRTLLLGALGTVSILLTVVSNFTLLPLLAVFVYLLAAAGIDEMLSRWFTVFPRNTLAQGSGIVLLTAVVLFSCFYNVRHYFVAWPAAPPTKAVHVIHNIE